MGRTRVWVGLLGPCFYLLEQSTVVVWGQGLFSDTTGPDGQLLVSFLHCGLINSLIPLFANIPFPQCTPFLVPPGLVQQFDQPATTDNDLTCSISVSVIVYTFLFSLNLLFCFCRKVHLQGQ